MTKVILDTDFILNAVRNKVDIAKEFARLGVNEICYLDKTLDELEGKKDAKLALMIIKKFKILKTTRDKIVDDLILEFKGYSVATQDRELKEKLKKRKTGVFTIRQKKYISKV